MSESESSQASITIPSETTLVQAAKLSLQSSKPICFYFYLESCKGNVTIAKNSTDKIIFKNMEEHTSPISNIYKVESEYLIVTKNTIYIISASSKVSQLPENFDGFEDYE